MIRAALGLALIAASCSCSSGTGPAAPHPNAELPAALRRADTAGDELIPLLPLGAEIVLEIDLARLRGNAVVGPLVQALEQGELGDDSSAPSRRGGAPLGTFLGLGREVIARTDALVMASYRVGTDEAESLVVARGARLRGYQLMGGVRVDDQTVALGPNTLLARLGKVAGGEVPALSRDVKLRAVRAVAMPAKAEGASLRVAARLGFDARVGLASMFDLRDVPASLSVWADVADDLAAIAILGGKDETEADRLARLARRLQDRIAREPLLRTLGLARLVREIDVSRAGTTARAVFIVGPTRLEKLVQRLAPRSDGL